MRKTLIALSILVIILSACSPISRANYNINGHLHGLVEDLLITSTSTGGTGGGYDNLAIAEATNIAFANNLIPIITPTPMTIKNSANSTKGGPTTIQHIETIIYELNNPTYNEMITFINHSTVVFHNYVGASNGNYVCTDFACDLQEAAALEGIRMAVVGIDFPGPIGHAIVAFETTDRGLIYFEPQANLPVRIDIGRSYWSWLYGVNIEWPDYDDTVVAIHIYWNNNLPWWCN